MQSQTSDEQPLPEPTLPQWSLRFLLSIITASAMVMWVFRAAVIDQVLWAQCLGMVIATAMGCFAVYAVAFASAWLFAAITGSIIEPMRAGLVSTDPNQHHAAGDDS